MMVPVDRLSEPERLFLETQKIQHVSALFPFSGPLKANPLVLTIQRKCIDFFDIPVKISKHTWENLNAHVYVDSRIIRVKLMELVVRNSGVLIKARSKRCDHFVPLLHITGVHFGWLQNGIVSDDDEEDNGNYFNRLPKLRVLASDTLRLLNTNAIGVLRTDLREVNIFVSMISSHF